MSQTLKIVNGDVVINSASGRPISVSNEIKLRQDIKEFFSIDVQPSGFGSGLEQLIGLVEISPDAFITMADRQIRDGISEFMRLQVAEQRIFRPGTESILGISGVIIERDTTDPTRFYFRVNFITTDGKQFSITNSVG